MHVVTHTLANGLEVIFIDTEAFPTVTTFLLVGAGSRYENPKNNGIAHFFEHIPFKGTKNYPTAYDISATIEGFGGMFNAFTSKDHTAYWIKATIEHFATMIDITGDMILAPVLDPAEIEREKGVIVEEINMYEDMPSRRVSEVLSQAMYPDHPLGMDILGTKETVTSFDKKTFTDYMKAHYYPNNAILVVAGGLKYSPKSEVRSPKLKEEGQNDGREYGQFIDIIEKKFGTWQQGVRPTFKKVTDVQKDSRVVVYHKKTEQAHFAIGFPAVSFEDPRKYAVYLLATILGGGSSSRLFIEVRERRGLCYYIGADREMYADTGEFYIQAGVPNNEEKLKQAVSVTLAECKKIKDEGLRKGEIERAKELLKGRLLISLEDSSRVAQFFGTRRLLQNSFSTPTEVIDNIMAVTEEQVIEAAKFIFQPKNINFAVIGPFEKNAVVTADLAI